MAAVLPAPGAAAVTPADRLSFTVFLALAIHAAVILGITFSLEERGPSTHTMEVTLAQHRSEHLPDKADFLAQFNQVGSGTLEQKAMITSPTQADFHDTEITETAPTTQIASMPANRDIDRTVVTTIADARKLDVLPDTPIEHDTDQPATGSKTLLQRSLEIASLEARLAQQRQIYAKRPRIKRLTSLSTASSIDAYYLNSWRRKIEKVGNINYPSEATRQKLYGSLRMLVTILPDGSLKQVRLLESSGKRVLDDAAIRIAKLASPFAPFPDELRQTTDELEIIRTWQFQRNSSLRSL